MGRKSPVKYKRRGNYAVQELVQLSPQQRKEAENRGKIDAQNPFDVGRTNATDYEKELQKSWVREINQRSAMNIGRALKWGDLIRRELNAFLLAKKEFTERLMARNYIISDSQLGKVPYVIILTLITAIEMPINIAVFDIFGENVLFTILLGGILSIVISLTAHFVGGWMKAEGLKLRSVGLMVTVLLLLLLIAWVRKTFFVEAEFSVMKDFFKSPMEFRLIAFLFFLINSLLFALSIVASYLAHESDPLFPKARKRYHRLHEKLSNLICAREEEVLNLHETITRCQECFKEQRHIYTGSYNLTGVPEPNCFKESIGVELARISGLPEQLKNIDDDFKSQKEIVESALAPIDFKE